jgi:hypothetical protein
MLAYLRFAASRGAFWYCDQKMAAPCTPHLLDIIRHSRWTLTGKGVSSERPGTCSQPERLPFQISGTNLRASLAVRLQAVHEVHTTGTFSRPAIIGDLDPTALMDFRAMSEYAPKCGQPRWPYVFPSLAP